MKFPIRTAVALSLWSSLLPLAAQAQPARDSVAGWYRALGVPAPGESFGGFVTRAARLKHGAPYAVTAPPPGAEEIRVDVSRFECVSFIESALSIARCGWSSDATEACFVRELERSRYRGGEMGDYSSRLHYFVDWIADNQVRGRVEDITIALGGTPIQRDFFHISRRVLPSAKLDPRERARLSAAVESSEAELSRTEHAVLGRDRATDALAGLHEGDIVAFTADRSGLLVHHAGFVYWAEGTPRLLHASSYHQRVVVTIEDVADYLNRRPERRGVIAVRPVAPTRLE